MFDSDFEKILNNEGFSHRRVSRAVDHLCTGLPVPITGNSWCIRIPPATLSSCPMGKFKAEKFVAVVASESWLSKSRLLGYGDI